MNKYFLIAGILLIGLCPLACQKTYNLDPLTAATNTPIPTPTPTCSKFGYSPVTCTSGITWGRGWVGNLNNNSVYQYGATLALTVNCIPETTDGVTMTGPGVILPLTYNGTTVIGSANYALYESNTVFGSLTIGDNYTLTSVTSFGTATATLPLPKSLTFTSGATTVMWNGSDCNINYFQLIGGLEIPDTGVGFEAGVSPVPFPFPCVSSCVWGAQFINSTYNINGGSGIYLIGDGVIP